MRNAIVISVYNSILEESKEYRSCMNTWEFYCKKYNIDLHLIKGKKYVNNDPTKPDYAAMCYDRWLEVDFPIDEYNRITFVDADTIIRWDAFDINEIFESNNIEIAVVHDQSGPGTPPYHFNQWLDFNPNIYSFVKGFFNAGFVSMRPKHLKELQNKLIHYREYYYKEKDIDSHVKGIGKKGGIKLDGLDNTAVCIILQELYSDEISWLPPTFNRQLSYIYLKDNSWIFWDDWKGYIEKISTFEFLNEAMVYHLGGMLLDRENIAETFWNNFKNYYNE